MNGSPYITRWEYRQHAADGGYRAALAASHEQIAQVLREDDDDLMAAGGTQFLYATQGTNEQRMAAVDAWAARHHVKAGQDERYGYCAAITGPYAVIAIALLEKTLVAA